MITMTAKKFIFAMFATLIFLFFQIEPAISTASTQEQNSEQEQILPEGDIDAFMAKVLERRKINWDELYDYVFSERETLEFGGLLAVAPVQGFRRDYVWYVRDGYLVRSPAKVNGAPVPDGERERIEQKWVESAREGKGWEGSLMRDNFFGFDFKKGEFFYAGRQEFEGREVVVIEYYPWGEFDDEDADEDELEERIEQQMSESIWVTMLVEPQEHQIVRMTLNNLGFDFLPGRWLVRVDEIGGTMTMHKPFGEVWLPRGISAIGRVSSAYGPLMVRYTKSFSDYAKSKVKVEFRYGPRGEEQ